MTGGFPNRTLGLYEVFGLELRKECGLFVEVTGHQAESGRDNASLVTLTAYNIKSDSGAEVDDDGGGAVIGLRGEGVGESILSNFLWFGVVNREPAAIIGSQVEAGFSGGL